jgi:hypothetical protein
MEEQVPEDGVVGIIQAAICDLLDAMGCEEAGANQLGETGLQAVVKFDQEVRLSEPGDLDWIQDGAFSGVDVHPDEHGTNGVDGSECLRGAIATEVNAVRDPIQKGKLPAKGCVFRVGLKRNEMRIREKAGKPGGVKTFGGSHIDDGLVGFCSGEALDKGMEFVLVCADDFFEAAGSPLSKGRIPKPPKGTSHDCVSVRTLIMEMAFEAVAGDAAPLVGKKTHEPIRRGPAEQGEGNPIQKRPNPISHCGVHSIHAEEMQGGRCLNLILPAFMQVNPFPI